MLRQIISLIDRDVGRWNGTPLVTVIIGLAPMMIWAAVTGTRPGDAPHLILVMMLAPVAVLGGIGVWRGWVQLWSEHRRIRALGRAEALNDEAEG